MDRAPAPFLLCLAAALCAAGLPASAAPAKADTRPSFGRCLDRSGGVTFEMLECGRIEHEYQDKRLNAAYKQAMAQRSKPERERLREKQRAWIKHRDSLCALDPDGGSAARIESASCNVEQTALRAAELEAMARGP